MSRQHFLIALCCSITACAVSPAVLRGGEPVKSTFNYQIVRPAFTTDDEPNELDSDSIATSAIGPEGTESVDAPNTNPAELSPQSVALRNKLRRVLKAYYPKHQNTRDNSAWEIMHEIIAYGVDSQLYQGGPGGPKINAIGWMCFNGSCKGEQMLYLDRGQLVARKGPGVQGHFGQFLAILAQSHLTSDYPMLVFGKKFTLRDLIECEKLDCQAGEELTFKLIGLMHYLDSNETWHSRDGQVWSIQRLISEELKQPIRGAACGGTHRLMGLSYAVNKRSKRGEPVDGEFRRAQAFINDYHRYTFGLQNPDGSFSTQWFVRREAKPDVDRRLKTTGHILEWLSFSLSDDELRQPQVVKAVDYLATILATGQNHTWEIGPLGHGLHALALYDARMFRGPSSERRAGRPRAGRAAAGSRCSARTGPLDLGATEFAPIDVGPVDLGTPQIGRVQDGPAGTDPIENGPCQGRARQGGARQIGPAPTARAAGPAGAADPGSGRKAFVARPARLPHRQRRRRTVRAADPAAAARRTGRRRLSVDPVTKPATLRL